MKENGKRLDWIINEPVLVFSLEGSVFIGWLRSASSLTSVIIAPLVVPRTRTRFGIKRKKEEFLSWSIKKIELVSTLLPFPFFATIQNSLPFLPIGEEKEGESNRKTSNLEW